MTFGERIRELRKQKNLSQQEAANELNVSLRTLKNYELDKTLPRTRAIYDRIAAFYNVDINYLLKEDEQFVVEANERYGARGKRQANELLAEVSGLFAGGERDEEDMDEMMKAIQDAYWIAKKRNRKYLPKKYRTDNTDSIE